MSNLDQRPKITVEDLLRLKRTERPSPEFWSGFERELRQKQLAALVEQRPWWRDLPQLLSRRAYLPVGATAILAFTFVSVKFYAPTRIARVDTPIGISAPVVPVATSSTLEPVAVRVIPSEREVELDDRTPVAAMPLSDRMPEQAVELVPWAAPRSAET